MDVGRALKAIAESKGISQSDICRVTDISDAYISMLFNSKTTNPRFDRLISIADALDVSLDDIRHLAELLPDPSKKSE